MKTVSHMYCDVTRHWAHHIRTNISLSISTVPDVIVCSHSEVSWLRMYCLLIEIENVDESCYLESVTQSNSICNRHIISRLGKASSVFSRLSKFWKDETSRSTYKDKTVWIPFWMKQRHGVRHSPTRSWKPAHHRWQRTIVGICWKDNIRNEDDTVAIKNWKLFEEDVSAGLDMCKG